MPCFLTHVHFLRRCPSDDGQFLLARTAAALGPMLWLSKGWVCHSRIFLLLMLMHIAGKSWNEAWIEFELHRLKTDYIVLNSSCFVWKLDWWFLHWHPPLQDLSMTQLSMTGSRSDVDEVNVTHLIFWWRMLHATSRSPTWTCTRRAFPANPSVVVSACGWVIMTFHELTNSKKVTKHKLVTSLAPNDSQLLSMTRWRSIKSSVSLRCSWLALGQGWCQGKGGEGDHWLHFQPTSQDLRVGERATAQGQEAPMLVSMNAVVFGTGWLTPVFTCHWHQSKFVCGGHWHQNRVS